MSGVISKNIEDPDSRDTLPLATVELVTLGPVTVARETMEPGWRWSTHVRPIVGTERCEFHHVGYQISGLWVCEDRDGVQTQIGPGDVYDIQPGHDAWVVGDEPSINIDFQGAAGYGLPPAPGRRSLLTVLFTDIVDSTAAVERMGDRRWAVLMQQHREDVGRLLGDHGGHEVKWTGDGFLATFDRPASAVSCAAAIRDASARLGFQVRAGIHTGEVERTENDLRGVAVHLTSRVMGAADPGEVLVSSTTRELATGSDLAFVEKGTFELKGIDGARTLYALAS